MPTMVTTYANPDLDGFSCAIAYAEFLNAQGQDAVTCIFGTPQLEVQYLMERFGFAYPAPVAHPEQSDHVVLCDASKLSDLVAGISPQNVTEIIDHRAVNDAPKFTNAKIQIELIGAAATLVAERFKNANRTPSKMAATLLYGGIISNSSNFQAPTTNARDHAMADWLHGVAGLPETFANEMLAAKSDLSGSRLTQVLRADLKTAFFGGKQVGIAQIEMIDADNLVATRKKEILEALDTLQDELRFDVFFLNIIDLQKGANILVADHKPTQALLRAVFGIEFKNNEARTDTILLRKQISPRLKAYLES